MNVITPTLVNTGQMGSVKDVFRAINAKFKEPLQRPYSNLGIRLYGVRRVYEAAAAIAYSGSDVSIEVDGIEYVLGAPTDIYDLAAKANDVLDIGWYSVNSDGALTVDGFHDFGDFIQGGVAVFTPEAETDIDILPVQTDINRELALRISNVSASITPAALTKVDDTNVVLTLGGSPSIALLNATSLTLSWTGVLSLARGGTNKNITASAGAVVYSDADSFEVSGVGTTGQAFISGGTGAPTWFAPTAGSVLFAGTSGILQQDNANLFWDDSNNRLGVGINSALTARLHVVGSGTTSATINFLTANSDASQSMHFTDAGIIYRNGAVYSVEVGTFARENTSWGYLSLATATGTENAAFGFNALGSVIGGGRLTAMGNRAGAANVSGSQGSYFGFQAGGQHTSDGASVFGEFSAYYATTASYMTAVGHRTMVDGSVTVGITGGSYVTAIGASAAQRGSNASISNSTYIGSRTISEASNEAVIGGYGNTNFYFGAGRFGTGGSSSLYAITMQPTSPASGSSFYANQTDANGVNWTFGVSQATGSGTSGDIIWQYAPSGSTGTTLTTLTEGMRFKGTTGQLQFSTIGAIFNPYGVSSGNTGELRFAELAAGGTNYVGFKAADAIGTTVIWTLPDSDSTGTQALVSNGSGVLSWASIGGGGTVTSVSGTANRITSSGGTTPVIDIAATYVGQTSITTLGTITTGTLSTGAVIGGVTMTLTSDATGDIYYRNAGGILTRLAIGSNTNVLTVSGGLPTWAAAGGSVPSGTSGQTLYYNGTTLTATSNLLNDGVDVYMQYASGNDFFQGLPSAGLFGFGDLEGEANGSFIQISDTAQVNSYNANNGHSFTGTGVTVNGTGRFTGALDLGTAASVLGVLKFNGNTSGTVTVQSAAAAGTWTLTLPTTDGNSGEYLQTNGSGVTTWAAITGFANTALSNLASVSINASLIPQTTLDLGATTTAWRSLYLYGSGTFGSHSMQFTGTPTGHRVITFEDATQTVANLTSTQTFTTGVKTFRDQMFAIRNPADTFSYTFVAAAIAANRNLTLPLITGTDTLACLGLAQAFSAEINMTKNGASVFSVGTTSFAYRTTNGGSGSSYQTVFNVDNSASTAGAQAFGFRTVDGFVFSVGNGTRQIARAMIQVINLVNTAGSEVGDLGFYVKSSGAAAGLVLTLSSGSLTVADPYNFVFGTTTGTKLGTSTSQKIGIWNATPIVQPTTAIAAATFAANTSAIANDTATFDGYTMGQVVKALRNFGMLA